MSDPYYFRDRAAQARRLAAAATDPILAASLTKFADEYDARANALEAKGAAIDPSGE